MDSVTESQGSQYDLIASVEQSIPSSAEYPMSTEGKADKISKVNTEVDSFHFPILKPAHFQGQKLSELVTALGDETTGTGGVGLKRAAVSTEVEGTAVKRGKKSMREWAYEAAAGVNPELGGWEDFGGLDCTKDSQQSQEL
jgi:hypothetical protein